MGVNYHDRLNFGGGGYQNLTHPFVSELAFGSILLDLWDGPTNFSTYNNPRGAIVYQDPVDPLTGYVEQYEMSFARILRPFINRTRQSVTDYYATLLEGNSFAEIQNIRNVWYYDFNSAVAPVNAAAFKILNTDEIAPLATVQTPYFTGTPPGTNAGTLTHTYAGTDTGQLTGNGSSYNVTTYIKNQYDTSGRLVSVETINANGVTLSDPVVVSGGASLLLHGSPRPQWYNASMPFLVTYTKRTDHLNIDFRGLARITVADNSQLEIGSVSPYQTASVNLYQGTFLSVESGATMRVRAGSTLNIWENGTLLVRNGGTLLVDGDLYIRWGGHICVEEGGNVTLTSSSTLYVDAGARPGVLAGVGLPTTLACSNKVAACGVVNIQNGGVTNVGGRNEALQFDGDDVVSIPNTNSWVNHSLTQQFAVEAFIRADNLSAGGAQTIFSSRHGSATSTYGYDGILFSLYGGQLLLQLDGRNYYSSANMVPNDNGCHHVAVTRDNVNRVRFYIDGRETTYSPTTPINAASAGSLNLGADNYSGFGEYFQGMIGEVRVWNFWRSGDQIRQNLTTKLAAPQNGLVAYYDMQDATGSQQLSDLSGVNNTGQNSVPGVLGANAGVGTDDPTWVAQCALACTVQGNFRTAALTWTAPDSTALSLGHRQKAKDKHNSIESLSISPNPATTSATVHFEHTQAGNVRVWVQDLAGAERAVVLQQTHLGTGPQNLTLPLNRLQPGLYLVVVQSRGGREHIRLQVN